MFPAALLFRRRVGVRFLAVFAYFLLAACWAQRTVGQQATVARPSPAGPFSAAGSVTGTRPIAGLWQFHLGDDPAWAQPGLDDRGWEQLPADKPWGDAGHPGYSGYAWYRRQVALDPADQKSLTLLLPPLDAVAEVYWNGVKVGGIGTLPPHAVWPNNPEPVVVPLSSVPGARSGELAIRVWERRLGFLDPPDAGGFQFAPQLGYGPLIQKMPRQWVEHRLCVLAVAFACYLLFFFVGIAALVLWTQARSEWVLLAVAIYVLCYSSRALVNQLPLDFTTASLTIYGIVGLKEIASLVIILLLADLPRRAGVRGARFWWRACMAFAVVEFLAQAASAWAVLLMSSPDSHLFHVLDLSSEVFADAYALFGPALLIACFLLSKLTLSRLLFLCAVGFDALLQLFGFLIEQNLTRIDWLSALIKHPVLQIYGSNLTIFTLVRVLVLLAIVYAVSDQIRRRVARQRFVDAELKAAQEVQQVMVPAAADLEAPGYAVSSVYRPASEVGGDFFQIIPLRGEGTLAGGKPDIDAQGDRTGGTLIVAGDVSGKGLRAAMTVSLVLGALRTLAEYDSSPAAVLAGLNRRLIGRTQGGFVTCCAVRIDTCGGAVMANAGHCQPYLDGHEMNLPNGIPLGIVADAEYEEVCVDVFHGQQLTLLSDGVVEARNPHGELYGFDRLNELMRKRPSAEHVAETAVCFGQEDDITVLTVTRLGSA